MPSQVLQHNSIEPCVPLLKRIEQSNCLWKKENMNEKDTRKGVNVALIPIDVV